MYVNNFCYELFVKDLLTFVGSKRDHGKWIKSMYYLFEFELVEMCRLNIFVLDWNVFWLGEINWFWSSKILVLKILKKYKMKKIFFEIVSETNQGYIDSKIPGYYIHILLMYPLM